MDMVKMALIMDMHMVILERDNISWHRHTCDEITGNGHESNNDTVNGHLSPDSNPRSPKIQSKHK